MSILTNNGDGTFATQFMHGVGSGPRSVVIGDLDGDSVADLTIANGDSDSVSVLLNICREPVAADLDGSGDVDVVDLLILFGAWGDCDEPCPPCPADLDGDCTVGTSDLLILFAFWD